MHGSTMVYLFVTPVALALGLYLVPLQVGAAELAGPRWPLWRRSGCYVLGGLAMWSGFLAAGGAAQASWWGFDPLSAHPLARASEWTSGSTGSMLATVGQMLWAVLPARSPRCARAPGMTMLRMPVFTWTMVATCSGRGLAFPVLIVALALLWAQRQLGGVLLGGAAPWPTSTSSGSTATRSCT